MKTRYNSSGLVLKALSFFFAVILIAGALPFDSSAAAPTVYQSKDTTVTLDPATKTVTVSGNGEMKEYASSANILWLEDAQSYSTIIVEEGVTRICSYAFVHSTEVKTLSLPSTLEEIGKSAFRECTSLTELEIPAGTKIISDKAFANCTGLSEIILNEGLEYIGDSAFEGCTSVAELTVPESVKHIGSYSLCLQYGGIVNLPEELDYIGYKAFYNSKYYRSLPNGLNVYSGCTLTYKGSPTSSEIVVPDGVVSLSELTFESNHLVTRIVLPDTLETICKQAVFDCTNLYEITIPDSVTKIENLGLGYFLIGTAPVRYTPFVIYGHAGHESERYALENEFPFVCLHEVGEYSYYPDCEAGGEAIPVCKWCGEEFEHIEIEKGNHSYGEAVTVQPTCTEYGCDRALCVLCGKTYETDIVPPSGHSYSDSLQMIKAPTCTEEGIVARECRICGDLCDVIPVTPVGHKTDGEWVTLSPATCTESGTEALYCAVCSDTVMTRETEATGHSVSDTWSVLVKSDAYEYQKGLRAKMCESCGIICEYEYFLAGDLDCDGAITSKDVKLIMKALLDITNDPDILSLSDLDFDGLVTTRDTRIIQRVMLGI